MGKIKRDGLKKIHMVFWRGFRILGCFVNFLGWALPNYELEFGEILLVGENLLVAL